MIELTLVVAILSIVLAVAFAGFVSLQKAQSQANERVQNLQQAQLLMDGTSRDLRTATRLQSGSSPFLIADAREMKFYAALTSTAAPLLVRFYVDTKARLVEEVTNADITSVAPAYTYSGAPKNRLVGQYIVNPTAQPIFTFYNSAGTALVTPLSDADKLAVDSVGITYIIKHTTTLAVQPTTLVNKVRLPNVDYQPLVGG